MLPLVKAKLDKRDPAAPAPTPKAPKAGGAVKPPKPSAAPKVPGMKTGVNLNVTGMSTGFGKAEDDIYGPGHSYPQSWASQIKAKGEAAEQLGRKAIAARPQDPGLHEQAEHAHRAVGKEWESRGNPDIARKHYQHAGAHAAMKRGRGADPSWPSYDGFSKGELPGSEDLGKAVKMPQYSERGGWKGGEKNRLYHITDKRTGKPSVMGVEHMRGVGPEVDIRHATRGEAEEHYQKPLHPGWKVEEGEMSKAEKAGKIIGQTKSGKDVLAPGAAYMKADKEFASAVRSHGHHHPDIDKTMKASTDLHVAHMKSHQGFTAEDHADAAKLHEKHSNRSDAGAGTLGDAHHDIMATHRAAAGEMKAGKKPYWEKTEKSEGDDMDELAKGLSPSNKYKYASEKADNATQSANASDDPKEHTSAAEWQRKASKAAKEQGKDAMAGYHESVAGHHDMRSKMKKSEIIQAAQLHYHRTILAQRLGHEAKQAGDAPRALLKAQSADRHAELCTRYVELLGLDPRLGPPPEVKDAKGVDLSKHEHPMDAQILGIIKPKLPLVKADGEGRHPLYQAALDADNEFHGEVKRQFPKNTGDMRYRSNQHDEKTKAAAGKKHAADEAWRNHMESTRKSDSTGASLEMAEDDLAQQHSTKANRTNSPDDHEIARQSSQKAAAAAHSAGKTNMANYWSGIAQHHQAKATAGGTGGWGSSVGKSEKEVGKVGKTTPKKGPLDIGDGFAVHRHGMDDNGNHRVYVSQGGGKPRGIRTNGNLPTVHSDLKGSGNLSAKGAKEIKEHYKKYVAKPAKKSEWTPGLLPLVKTDGDHLEDLGPKPKDHKGASEWHKEFARRAANSPHVDEGQRKALVRVHTEEAQKRGIAHANEMSGKATKMNTPEAYEAAAAAHRAVGNEGQAKRLDRYASHPAGQWNPSTGLTSRARSS